MESSGTPTQGSAPTPTATANVQGPDPRRALKSFRAIESPILDGVLRYFWLFQAGLLMVDAVLFHLVGTRNIIRLILVLSPHVFVAWASLLAYRVLQRLPETLLRVWNRNVFTPRSRPPSALEIPEFPGEASDGPRKDVRAQYEGFVQHFQARLSHAGWHRNRATLSAATGGRLLVAVGFTWLLYWFFHRAGFPLLFPFHLPKPGLWLRVWLTLDIGIQIVLAFMLGLVAWRLIIVAIEVARLSREFDFKLHVRDPDRSAGLKPLGDLCFSIAATWGVAAIYPTGWLITLLFQVNYRAKNPIPTFHSSLCSVPTGRPCFDMLVGLTWYFALLLGLTFVLAVGTFFAPLYAVHRGMERARPAAHEKLDRIGREFGELSASALHQGESLDAGALEKLNQRIDWLEKEYESNRIIPTWPFDRRVFAKFVGTTIIPLSGLTTWLPQLIGKLAGAS